jgi:cold-inducible RNA-binding protein
LEAGLEAAIRWTDPKRDKLTAFSVPLAFCRTQPGESRTKKIEDTEGRGRRLPMIFPPASERERIDSMKLYVGNLSYNVSDDQLRDLFARFGTPTSVAIITDRNSGQSKGFGFVEFSDDAQAKAALSLNGTEFAGRNLTVNEARPRAEATGNRSRY